MLWILIPVLLAIFLMELYFSRYSRESLGHHKSLENTIFLLFISFNLLHHILINNYTVLKLYLTGMFITFWIIIGIMDFFHKLSTSIIFRVSSKYLVAFSAYVAIILVYSDILNSTGFMHVVSVVLSVILLFFTLVVIKKLLEYFEPKSYEEIEHFLKNIEEDIRKASRESEEIVKKKKN